MIFPNVKKYVHSPQSISFPENPVYEFQGVGTEALKQRCPVFGCNYSGNGNIRIITEKVTDREMLHNEAGIFTDEKYSLELTQTDIPVIRIRYCFERGLRHAFDTVMRIVNSGKTVFSYIEDFPSFTKRGFIEGFYGKPWDDGERYSIMKLMSFHHMNTYYYAPKYDVYHREKWQEKYDGEALKKLSSLVETARELDIDFYWCIAPGLTVQYSCQEQFYILMDKIKQVYDIGVRHFGILLDDISPSLQYESDRAAYDSLESAHICYVNNIYRALKELDSANTLTFCPFLYHGTGTEKYISEVGSSLESDIEIFWTGKNICSQELTSDEAVAFFKSTGHLPLYWDNFPVNDAEMMNEMHLCPLTGRDSQLFRYSSGLIANCMSYAECSKIPLITVADYLWNSRDYSPRESYENACEEINGKGTYRIISYFTDNLFFSCLKDDNSVLMNACLYSVRFLLGCGKTEQAVSELSSYASKFRVSTNSLSDSLKKELSFWIEKHNLCADLLDACLEYIKFPCADRAKAVKEKADRYNFHPARHADFCIQEFTDFLLNQTERDINI